MRIELGFVHILKQSIIYLYYFIPFVCSLAAYANQNTEERYFAPSFRSGHNLSLFSAAESSAWKVSQKPDVTNPDEIIAPAQESKIILSLIFKYTYHINIISGFGFFVGSSAGVLSSNGYYGIEKNFFPGYGVSFPTVLGGLVQSIGQDFRLLSGIEYGATWFPQMKISTISHARKELSAVEDMLNIFIGVDHFITRNTALSFNAGYREITTPCINSCNSSIYLNSLGITNKSYYAQLGMTWLVGELNQSL